MIDGVSGVDITMVLHDLKRERAAVRRSRRLAPGGRCGTRSLSSRTQCVDSLDGGG